jgi:hypothetical protein
LRATFCYDKIKLKGKDYGTQAEIAAAKYAFDTLSFIKEEEFFRYILGREKHGKISNRA